MTPVEITSLFKTVFGTPHGQKCLEFLKTKFVDRSVYKQGQTYDFTAFKEGQRDVVQQILKEVTKNGN